MSTTMELALKTTPRVASVKKKKGTPAQFAAAQKRQTPIDWITVIDKFRRAKQNNICFEMGTPGSTQVTRVRLVQWEGFEGLNAFTRGSNLFISKLPLDQAVKAAKKAGRTKR